MTVRAGLERDVRALVQQQGRRRGCAACNNVTQRGEHQRNYSLSQNLNALQAMDDYEAAEVAVMTEMAEAAAEASACGWASGSKNAEYQFDSQEGVLGRRCIWSHHICCPFKRRYIQQCARYDGVIASVSWPIASCGLSFDFSEQGAASRWLEQNRVSRRHCS